MDKFNIFGYDEFSPEAGAGFREQLEDESKLVNFDEFNQFAIDFHDGKYPHLRFGQAFVNKFYPNAGEVFSDIFYNTDTADVTNIIFERYITYG